MSPEESDGWTRLLGSPQSALLAFLVAAAFTVLAFALRRGTFEVAMLWVLVASALAILSAREPQYTALLMAAAQLAMLFALVEDSYRLAYHDQLTGLPGRRALDETLGRLEGDYVLAMVDVDHFKKFNDRFGHDVGDQALRMVGDELAGVGDGGRAFRYGGEEFSVVFTGRKPAQTWDTLDALRSSIAARSFAIRSPKRPRKKPEKPTKPTKSPVKVNLTVSIGAAGPSPRRTQPDEVLKAADGALYKAKRRGRNRLVIEGVRAKPRRKKT
jgi:diguanylate cyclase (GGDEF)-like protein